MDRNILSSNLNVPVNRIYLGRKSTRREMRKLHDWVAWNSNTLMNLKLQTAASAGYKILYSQDPSLNAEDTLFNHYISSLYDIKTRKLVQYDEFGNLNPSPDNENFDSSFFNISLLKDTRHDMNSVIYLGLQNRRTDPLIYINEEDMHHFDHPLYHSIGLHFIPTAEFDSLTDSQPEGGFWQSKWFERLGSREITLQFNYKYPTDTNQYCLLHITELLDSSAYDPAWPYWRREKWYRRIDTVVGQDRDLAIKFLPGEGKIFKVEILPPDSNLVGILNNSNQHKLTVMPDLLPDGTESPILVRYHLVYHRFNNELHTNQVFYRRSFPVFRDDNSSAIKWEPEVCLSDTIIHPMYACPPDPPGLAYNPNSVNPSIVVRKEGTEQYAYIVFQTGPFVIAYLDTICPATDDYCYADNPIYEARLKVSGDPFVINSEKANIIERAVHTFDTLDANPTINAGPLGNYITWADSLCGLKVAFQEPGSIMEIPDNHKTATMGDFGSIPMIFLRVENPSVNPYSTDNYVSVVWQQREIWQGGSKPPSQICYARFFYDINENRVHTISLPDIFGYKERVDQLNNVLEIQHNNNIDNLYPTILSYKNYTTSELVAFQWGWDMFSANGIGTKRMLLINSRMYINPINSIWQWPEEINSKFVEPNITYNSSFRYSNNKINEDYTRIIDFVRSTNSSKEVYQTTEENLRFNNNGIYFNFNRVSINKITNGIQPHLATSEAHFTNESMDIWKQNRVVNDEANPPHIFTNKKLFYKGNDEDIVSEKFVGFESGLFFSVYSPPILDGENLGYYLPYTLIQDSIIGDYYIPNDTCDSLYTEWFTVNEMATLIFDRVSNNRPQISEIPFIQKRSDSTIFYPIGPTEIDVPFVKNEVILKLLDGGGEEYRFVLIKFHDTTSKRYTEKMFINFDSTHYDTLLFKDHINNENIIDLGGSTYSNTTDEIQLNIFPNPATNEIYVKALLPKTQILEEQKINKNLTLTLFNTLGIEILTMDIQAGKVIKIPIKNLAGGVYFVNVYQRNEYNHKLQSSLKKVIILK